MYFFLVLSVPLSVTRSRLIGVLGALLAGRFAFDSTVPLRVLGAMAATARAALMRPAFPFLLIGQRMCFSL